MEFLLWRRSSHSQAAFQPATTLYCSTRFPAGRCSTLSNFWNAEVAPLCDPQLAPHYQVLELAIMPAAHVEDHLEPVKLCHVLKALLPPLIVALLTRLIIVRLLCLENNVNIDKVKAASRLVERSRSFLSDSPYIFLYENILLYISIV